jgi:hypothetical protein
MGFFITFGRKKRRKTKEREREIEKLFGVGFADV